MIPVIKAFFILLSPISSNTGHIYFSQTLLHVHGAVLCQSTSSDRRSHQVIRSVALASLSASLQSLQHQGVRHGSQCLAKRMRRLLVQQVGDLNCFVVELVLLVADIFDARARNLIDMAHVVFHFIRVR